MAHDPGAHWESVHSTKPVDGVSWWQPEDELWLDLIDDLHLAPDDLILDVGSGSSLLVDALLARGHRRLVAVDVSSSALERIRERVGERPGSSSSRRTSAPFGSRSRSRSGTTAPSSTS